MSVAIITGAATTMHLETVKSNQSPYLLHFNNTLRKFGLDGAQRKALFIAQANWETAQWRNLTRYPMMHEWGFGKFNIKNPATKYYGAFYGRGIMQLTWAANYDDYLKFFAPNMLPHAGAYSDRLLPLSPRITAISTHWTVHPNDGGTEIRWASRYNPNLIADDPARSCDSGGFYWVSKKYKSGLNIGRKADLAWTPEMIGDVSRSVNGGGNGYIERQAYTAFVARFLLDGVDTVMQEVINTPCGSVRVDFTSSD